MASEGKLYEEEDYIQFLDDIILEEDNNDLVLKDNPLVIIPIKDIIILNEDSCRSMQLACNSGKKERGKKGGGNG